MARDDGEFDFLKALKALHSGKPLTGKDGILTPCQIGSFNLPPHAQSAHIAYFPECHNLLSSKTE